MHGTVYLGGDIITMAEGPRPEALWVQDGLVRALGSREAVLAQAGPARRFDLGGGAVLPAFIDAHSHIVAYAQTMGLVSLAGASSFKEILQRLQTFLRERRPEPGAWLVGFGYDHNFLAEGRHPDLALLDRAGEGHPVLLSHASGHMGVMNTVALRESGVAPDTPDPAGGRIGRDDAGGLTGYLEETAFTALSAKVPPPTPEQLQAQMNLAQDAYLRRGIVTVQDGLTRPGDWALLRAMAERGLLRTDVVAYPDLATCPNLLPENRAWLRYRDRLRLGGYKLILDGSPQGRTAWLTQPYLGGEAGYCGYPTHPDEAVNAFVERAYREGRQILVHCNGDAAADQFIAACERARSLGLECVRPVMIHAQLLRRDQLPRLAAAGIIASFFVAHTYFWGDIHVQNLGSRAEAISPVRSAIAAGVRYTFHQDTPVLEPDMLTTLWCAVNRLRRSGAPLGPGERITPAQALAGITCNAAYQYGEERHKGALREGMRGDLVVLDRSPLRVDPLALRDIRVLQTVRAGDVLFEA